MLLLLSAKHSNKLGTREMSHDGGANLIETLLTQWRSSVGVLNPSPLNTWPKWPPHAAQVISVLLPSGSG